MLVAQQHSFPQRTVSNRRISASRLGHETSLPYTYIQKLSIERHRASVREGESRAPVLVLREKKVQSKLGGSAKGIFVDSQTRHLDQTRCQAACQHTAGHNSDRRRRMCKHIINAKVNYTRSIHR